MNFLDIELPKKEVSLGGGQSFTVSGISANAVFGLYHRHRADLSGIFEQLVAGNTDAPANSIEALVAQFPHIVAEVIALAVGGDPLSDNWPQYLDKAKRLSLPIQVDALFAIADVTFTPEMPPKKFFGLLVVMIQQANSLTPTLGSGSGN